MGEGEGKGKHRNSKKEERNGSEDGKGGKSYGGRKKMGSVKIWMERTMENGNR